MLNFPTCTKTCKNAVEIQSSDSTCTIKFCNKGKDQKGCADRGDDVQIILIDSSKLPLEQPLRMKLKEESMWCYESSDGKVYRRIN